MQCALVAVLHHRHLPSCVVRDLSVGQVGGILYHSALLFMSTSIMMSVDFPMWLPLRGM